jgi:SAM-dependent methyltransferase
MTTLIAAGEPAPPFEGMPDVHGYLLRMAAPLRDKLFMSHFIAPDAKHVLDVGCADGAITLAQAEMFPKVHFHGIDLSGEFVELARKAAQDRGITNVTFEKVYLRSLLSRKRRYRHVQFVSVNHEFFSYGEGISSVNKALSDAHELLEVNGTTNIRDMVLEEWTYESDSFVAEMVDKIKARANPRILREFTDRWGAMQSIAAVNHFLLKYMYEQNFERENNENYIGVSREQYYGIFNLLGMRCQYAQSYALPFLADKWANDFGFTAPELSVLHSTTILIAQKMPADRRHVR